MCFDSLQQTFGEDPEYQRPGSRHVRYQRGKKRSLSWGPCDLPVSERLHSDSYRWIQVDPLVTLSSVSSENNAEVNFLPPSENLREVFHTYSKMKEKLRGGEAHRLQSWVMQSQIQTLPPSSGVLTLSRFSPKQSLRRRLTCRWLTWKSIPWNKSKGPRQGQGISMLCWVGHCTEWQCSILLGLSLEP